MVAQYFAVARGIKVGDITIHIGRGLPQDQTNLSTSTDTVYIDAITWKAYSYDVGLTSWVVLPGSEGGGGGGLAWQYVNADFTIANGVGYIVDTSGGPVIGTIPETLTELYAGFKDYAGTFGTDAFTIARHPAATYTLIGGTADITVDRNFEDVTIAFDATNNNVSI